MYLSYTPIGSQLFQADEVVSTNDWLSHLVADGTASHGAVLHTGFQHAGRGEGGNTWESEREQNLLMSAWIAPMLKADEQVYLNLFVSLGVFDMVNALLPGRPRIKWPNDIYVDDRKVAGILLENAVQGSVIKSCTIGIGLNVNQKQFSVPKAVSLATLLGRDLSCQECLSQLIACLNARYTALSMQLKNKLKEDYLDVLYKKDVKHLFRINNEVVEGEIKGIDAAGRLQLHTSKGMNFFGLKEVEYV